MFKNKCSGCGKRISKKYEFCPFCGISFNSKSEDYGFLGKEDINGLQLPFGFKTLLKPLLKELDKQMQELDKEMKNNQNINMDKTAPFTNFSIHIATPGNKPIKINSVTANNGMKLENVNNFKEIKLPKLNSESLLKSRTFPRVEPENNIRRLADKIIYEIFIPNVKSEKNINITKLENGFEIKAIGKQEVFVKNINVNLPFINYFLEDNKLSLEFDLR